jgi:hypothetical protein
LQGHEVILRETRLLLEELAEEAFDGATQTVMESVAYGSNHRQ